RILPNCRFARCKSGAHWVTVPCKIRQHLAARSRQWPKNTFVRLQGPARGHPAAMVTEITFIVDGETLILILRQSPSLERLLQKGSQIMAMQVTQIAACNRLHEVDERLARWLLMSA